MKPDRWQQIDRLFQAALTIAPNERESFLEDACKGDSSLRDEVESLLASYERADSFIEAPAPYVAAELLAENPSDEAETIPTKVFDRATKKSVFFWIALLMGAFVIGLYVFAAVMVFRYGGLTKDFGWSYASSGQAVYVTDVDPQRGAAGRLQAGDQILAINNETRVSRVAPYYVLREISAGSFYTIRIQRNGDEFESEQRLPPPTTDPRYFGPALSLLAVSVVFYVLGMLIGILRPGERVAQLACIGALAGAVAELETVLRPIRDLFQGPEIPTYSFLFAPFNIIIWAIAYHFFYRFPPGVPEGSFWSFLKRLSYGWAAIFCLMVLSAQVAYFTGNQSLITVFFNSFIYLKVIPAVNFLLLFMPFAICSVILRNYRRLTDPDQRRRMKWVIYGSVAGTVPTLTNSIIFFILAAVGGRGGRQANLPQSTWFRSLDLISDLAIVIIPITFSYAIVKHKVFDINVVVRRGLQYALAKNVLRTVLALPLVGLALQILSDPNQTISDIVFHHPIYLFLAAAAGISLKSRRRLTGWIDRKFFRDVYNQERILVGLIDEIKDFDSMADISKLVSNKIDSALHLTRIQVFYRKDDSRDLTLGYSSGDTSLGLQISDGSKLLRFMEGQESAQQYPFAQRQVLPRGEQAWLDKLGINLIVPMSGTDGTLIGLLLLGEKKSEQPYTANDRRLLESIARQIAVVYENVLLKQHVDKEARIKREVLAHLEEQNINLVKECPDCGNCYDSASQVCEKDGRELTLTMPVERTIDGKYRLDRLLGKGGMGAVYQATDLRLARQVAIKILTGDLFGNQNALRRFEREARALARLDHPNIVAVHDYGRAAAEGAYLVLELVPGVTLRDEMRRLKRLPPELTARWFDQVLEGVKAAHREGIIHRDLKPENILIAAGDQHNTLVKIADFGLAKLKHIDPADPNTLTATGVVMGTINYMSPEQLSGDDADERSDIFSLGVMVVEALTGDRPFYGRNYSELLISILHTPYHLNESDRQTAQLDDVLQRCIAKDRNQRYPTVAALQKELIPAIEVVRTQDHRLQSPTLD